MKKPDLTDTPEKPGVYLFKDSSGKHLYVGKAKSIRKRVKNYFQESSVQNPRITLMLEKATTVEYIVTSNEVEALLFENNLIKQFKPKFNIRLRDDKQYPFIRITTNEEIPRVQTVRKMQNDSASYYGPYTSVSSVREIIKTLMKAFKLCTCKGKTSGNSKKPCLNYQMNLCSAPCSSFISKEEYIKSVNEAMLFLEGKNEEVFKILNKRMKDAALSYEYESAGSCRDSINAINMLVQKQRVSFISDKDQDVISIKLSDKGAAYCLLSIRKGNLICQKEFFVEDTFLENESGLLEAFIKQYYQSATFIPSEIITDNEIGDKKYIEILLSKKKGLKVRILSPKKAGITNLMAMASENAELSLKSRLKKDEILSNILNSLKYRLALTFIPERIESIDISNTMGSNSVGAVVVWEKGVFKKNEYRRFLIKNKKGIDDFAMIEEVVSRRVKRLRKEEKELPNLFLIDGGVGQVNKALKAIAEAGAGRKVDVIGLSKGKKYIQRKSAASEDEYSHEEIIIPGRPNPIRMKKDSSELMLLQSIRDEVHRFAISYHKRLRQKSARSSILDDIKGLGVKRKKQLLKAFGSIGEISKYSSDEISRRANINIILAETVLEKIKILK